MSLCERVGGYDIIAAFVDDLLPRVVGDPEIGVYWRGHSNDTKRLERQLTVDFICEMIGGPVVYRGRDMKTWGYGEDRRVRLYEQSQGRHRRKPGGSFD